MRLLLDTHIVLGVFNRQIPVLPVAVQELLADVDSEYYVSVASLWEIAIKWRLRKLELSFELQTLPGILSGGGLKLLPINEHHVLSAVDPEPLTRDPFDRLLLAQCQVEGLRLITLDRVLVSHRLAASTA